MTALFPSPEYLIRKDFLRDFISIFLPIQILNCFSFTRWQLLEAHSPPTDFSMNPWFFFPFFSPFFPFPFSHYSFIMSVECVGYFTFIPWCWMYAFHIYQKKKKKVKENKFIKYIVYAIITDRDWPFVSL